MIEAFKGRFKLVCDTCGEGPGEEFYEFKEATNFARSEGWKTEKLGDDWIHTCPGCLEDED